MNSSENNPNRVDYENVVVSFEDYGVASNKCIITDPDPICSPITYTSFII